MPNKQEDLAFIEELRTRNIEYFVVSNKKLIFLSICTFDLYLVYWFYKNWKIVAVKGKEKNTPWAYALFSGLTSYGLFNRILLNAEAKGYVKKQTAGTLAALYIICIIAGRFYEKLPGGWNSGVLFIVSCFTFVPILYIQDAIRFINTKIDPESKEQMKFHPFEIFLLVVGGGIFLLAVIGSFIPN